MVNDSDNTTPSTTDQVKPESDLIKTPSVDVGKNADVSEAENEKDRNWRAFRESRKKERADREAAEARAADKEREVNALKAAMEAAFNGRENMQSSQVSHQGYGHEAEQESEDARIEKKVQAALAQREASAERARLERAQQEYPIRLRKEHPDFDQVVSQENLDYLDYHYPEVSRPIQRLGDGYEKWEDVYKAVIKFVPNNKTAKQDAQKADSNFSKPRSMSSSGLSQNTQAPMATSLSEDRKAENWARMQKAMRTV